MLAKIIRRIPLDADQHHCKTTISLKGEFLAHIRVITSTLQLIEQAVASETSCLDEPLIEEVFSVEEHNDIYNEDDDAYPADKLLGKAAPPPSPLTRSIQRLGRSSRYTLRHSLQISP